MTEPTPTPPQAARSHPAGVALSILASLSPLPLCMAASLLFDQVWIALLAVPLCVLVAWWMLRLRRLNWSDVGFRRTNSWPRLLGIVVISTFLLLVVTSMMGQALAAVDVKPDLSQFEPLRGNTAFLLGGLLLVWTTAAFGEELLMRGFLMHSFRDLINGRVNGRAVWLAPLIVVSVIFGFAHAYQGLAGIIMTGVIGFGYGLVFFAARRDLWAPILTHGLYDTVGFLIIYTSADELLPEGATMMMA